MSIWILQEALWKLLRTTRKAIRMPSLGWTRLEVENLVRCIAGEARTGADDSTAIEVKIAGGYEGFSAGTVQRPFWEQS
jgi:hypothetical protein